MTDKEKRRGLVEVSKPPRSDATMEVFLEVTRRFGEILDKNDSLIGGETTAPTPPTPPSTEQPKTH